MRAWASRARCWAMTDRPRPIRQCRGSCAPTRHRRTDGLSAGKNPQNDTVPLSKILNSEAAAQHRRWVLSNERQGCFFRRWAQSRTHHHSTVTPWIPVTLGMPDEPSSVRKTRWPFAIESSPDFPIHFVPNFERIIIAHLHSPGLCSESDRTGGGRTLFEIGQHPWEWPTVRPIKYRCTENA